MKTKKVTITAKLTDITEVMAEYTLNLDSLTDEEYMELYEMHDCTASPNDSCAACWYFVYRFGGAN